MAWNGSISSSYLDTQHIGVLMQTKDARDLHLHLPPLFEPCRGYDCAISNRDKCIRHKQHCVERWYTVDRLDDEYMVNVLTIIHFLQILNPRDCNMMFVVRYSRD